MNLRLKRLWFWLCWPGLYTYFIRSARSRVILRDADGRILLVEGKWKRWFDLDDWGLPGGGLHRHEAPADGAARELGEELGVSMSPVQLRPLGTIRITQYGISYTAHILCGYLDAATPLRLQRSEIVAATWFTPGELDHMTQKPEVIIARRLLAANP